MGKRRLHDPGRPFYGIAVSKNASTVAVLGASPKPDRYAFRALRMLLDHGHRAVPVNPAFTEILGLTCYPHVTAVPEPIDTLTLYLGHQRSEPLIDEILAAHPRRIIVNPGAENPRLETAARTAGIEVVHDCTLVMLAGGRF